MEYTIVGKITNTHGLKGELKVYPLTDDAERFFDLHKVYIGDSKEEVSLKSVKIHKGMILVQFESLEDINQVLKYRNQYLYIDDSDKINLPEDFYFIHDLLGCKVKTKEDFEIGQVTDVIQGAANDVYVIKNNDGKEILIPAVKAFIVSVNIADKLIVIDPIEGMIE